MQSNYEAPLAQRVRLDRILQKIAHESRQLSASLVARRAALADETFNLWGYEFSYFVHPYNMTWRNERAVEVPIAQQFLAGATGRVMEFGNVLAHYGVAGHIVIDKYESGPGVVNEDIIDYSPTEQFDRIVSVSTIEHVGWDETPRQPEKLAEAMDRLLALLAPGGTMLMTAPMGYNDFLDEAVLARRWPASRQVVLVRTDLERNRFVASDELITRPYVRKAGRAADAVWVVEFTAPA